MRISTGDMHLMGEEIMEETGDEPAAFCEAVAQACEVSPNDYALGLSKLFLKVRLPSGAVPCSRRSLPFLPFLPSFPSFPSPQKADRASRRH